MACNTIILARSFCTFLSDGSNVRMASCSAVQGDVLTAMHSLVDHALVAWPSDDDEPPDQHYQALLLRAISIILLNPWIDDDQTGRRCLSPLPYLSSHNKACHGTASLNLLPKLLSRFCTGLGESGTTATVACVALTSNLCVCTSGLQS